MFTLLKNIKNIATASFMLWISILWITNLLSQNNVHAEPLSILKDNAPQDLNYDKFRSIGIPDSDYYVPVTDGTVGGENSKVPNSSISNNCVRRGTPGDNLGRYGNIQNGSQGFYNTGNDRQQAAYFCKFWVENDARCAAQDFIDKFNNPRYKQDTDIVPTDQDVRKCIQHVKVGDRCLLTKDKIDPVSHTIVNEAGVARTIYSGKLNPATFGVVSQVFYCDLAGNAEENTEGLGGTIQVIDARCNGNPNLQENGAQKCLRGRFVENLKGGKNPSVANSPFLKDYPLPPQNSQTQNPQNGQTAPITHTSANIEKTAWFRSPVQIINDAIEGLFLNFGNLILLVITAILAIVAMVLHFISSVLANIINYIILINPASDNLIGVSRSISKIVESIAYLMIVVAVAGTGVMYAFKGKNSVGQIQQILLTIAVVTIGINFSFYIVAALIALSYQLGYIFSAGIVAGALGNGYEVANIFSTYNDSLYTNFKLTGDYRQFFSFSGESMGPMFGNVIQVSVLAVVFGFLISIYMSLLKTLVVRVAVLFMLLVSSPIGFVLKFSDFEPFKKIGNKWYNTLISYVLSYPMIVILLAFGIALNVQIGNQLNAQFLTTSAFVIEGDLNMDTLIEKGIQFFVPLLVKIAISLGVLMLIKQIIDEHLVPFADGVRNAIARSMNGATRGAKNTLAGIGRARQGLNTAIGVGMSARAVAARLGNNFMAANAVSAKHGIIGGITGIARNLIGRDAETGKKARVDKDGTSSVVAAARRGFVHGQNWLDTNRASMFLKAQWEGIKGQNEMHTAEAKAQISLQLRANAQTPAEIALADKFDMDNNMPSTHIGKGAYQMKKLTDDDKIDHIRRAGRAARSKRLAPYGLDKMDTDELLDLASSHMDVYLDKLAKEKKYNTFESMPEGEEKEALKREAYRSFAEDGGNNPVVKSIFDSLGKKMGQSEANTIRGDKNLSSLFASKEFQDHLLQTGSGREAFKKMYGESTLVGLMNADVRKQDKVAQKAFDVAVQNTVKNPEKAERKNLQNADFRLAVEEEVGKNTDPRQAVEIYQKLGLQGTRYMEQGIMTTVEDIIKNTAGATDEQKKVASAFAREVFTQGVFSPKELKDMATRFAEGTHIDELIQEQKEKLLNADGTLNLVNAVKGQGVASATKKMIGETIKNLSDDINDANGVFSIPLGADQNGQVISQTFSKQDAVEHLLRDIQKASQRVGTVKEKMKIIKSKAKEYFGETVGDTIIKAAEGTNGNFSDGLVSHFAANGELKGNLQAEGVDQYTKMVTGEIKKQNINGVSGQALVDQFHVNALSTPEAAPAKKALENIVRTATSQDSKTMLSATFEGLVGPDVAAAENNRLLKEQIEILRNASFGNNTTIINGGSQNGGNSGNNSGSNTGNGTAGGQTGGNNNVGNQNSAGSVVINPDLINEATKNNSNFYIPTSYTPSPTVTSVNTVTGAVPTHTVQNPQQVQTQTVQSAEQNNNVNGGASITGATINMTNHGATNVQAQNLHHNGQIGSVTTANATPTTQTTTQPAPEIPSAPRTQQPASQQATQTTTQPAPEIPSAPRTQQPASQQATQTTTQPATQTQNYSQQATQTVTQPAPEIPSAPRTQQPASQQATQTVTQPTTQMTTQTQNYSQQAPEIPSAPRTQQPASQQATQTGGFKIETTYPQSEVVQRDPVVERSTRFDAIKKMNIAQVKKRNNVVETFAAETKNATTKSKPNEPHNP